MRFYNLRSVLMADRAVGALQAYGNCTGHPVGRTRLKYESGEEGLGELHLWFDAWPGPPGEVGYLLVWDSRFLTESRRRGRWARLLSRHR